MAITKIESMRDVLRIWFFWKKQAIAVFLVIVGVVMFYAYTTTPKYEATAKLLVLPKTNQDLVLTAGDDERQIIKPITTEDLNTEIDIIRGKKVIHDTVASFPDHSLGLKTQDRGLFDLLRDGVKGTINWVLKTLGLKNSYATADQREAALLQRSLKIFSYDVTNIIEVSLLGDTPEQTKTVLERLLVNYIKHHKRVFTINNRDQFYDAQTSDYQEKLHLAEQNLKNFLKDSRIVDLDQQNSANVMLFTDLQRQLQSLEISYDESKARIDIFNESMRNDNVLVTRDMRIIPAINELEKSIVPLLLKRSEISKNFTKGSREYMDINSQIDILGEEVRHEVRKAIDTDVLELAALMAKKKSLKAGIKKIRNEAVALQEKNRILQELKRQVSFMKKNYLLYAAKAESSRMYTEQKSRNITNINIADAPSLPVNPVSPKKLLLLILSTFFGFVSAICTPFLLESIDQKLKTIDDVEDGLGLPVICSYAEV